MKRPFVYLIIPLVLGIYFCYSFRIENIYLFITLIILLIGLVVSIIRQKWYGVILFSLIFVLGGLITNLKFEDSRLINFKDKNAELEGIVKEIVCDEENYNKYLIDNTKLIYDRDLYDISEKVILKTIGEKKLNIGDRIVFEGTIREPNENTNPGLFDYKLYLNTNNIFTTMSIKDTNVYVISRNHLSKAEKFSLDFKARIEDLFDNHFNSEHSSLMKSMLLGDADYLDDNIVNRFRELGLAHVLAVSGLHIGIISLFLIYTLCFIGFNRKTAIIITVVFIWVYGFFIGYPASVLRASIMFSFLMLSNLIYRRYDPINLISLAAFSLLIYNPLWLFSVGFQFSFAATLSLLLFTPKIQGLFLKKYKKIGQALSPLFAIQLGLSPIIIFHFNYMSIISIFSNLILIPVISIALIIGFAFILMGFFAFGFLHGILKIAAVILSLLLYIIDLFTYIMYLIPFTSITLPSPSVIATIVYYIIIFISLRLIKLDVFNIKIIKSVIIYLIILIMLLSLSSIGNNQKITVDFIDVGQGDCSLIHIGDRNFLIDSGGTPFSDFDIGENVLLPLFQKQGINKLDGVFISHFDSDHCEGILSLFDDIRIDNLFIGYENENNSLCTKIIELCGENDTQVRILNAGDNLFIGKDKYIKVLSPSLERTYTLDDNNLSLVLLFEAHNKKILFTGDIEKETEKRLINTIERIDIDVLKVPHHGSKSSSSEKFIDFFNPEYVIIQVGQNFFGHPDKDVLNRYIKNNTEIYRNDIDGLIRVTIDKKEIRVEPYLPEKQSFISFLLNNYLQITIYLIFLTIGICFIGNYKKNLYYDMKLRR